MKYFVVFILGAWLVSVLLLATVQPGHAEANNFYALVQRAFQRHANVYVYTKVHDKGNSAFGSQAQVVELGDDFFCTAHPYTSGWAVCYKFDDVSYITLDSGSSAQ